MNVIIRDLLEEERPVLKEFLYQAIFVPLGQSSPPREVLDTPELQVYLEEFGMRPTDYAVVAQCDDKLVGAAWARVMNDYGHLYDDTPSLAISLFPEYRGMGLGTRLLSNLLERLRAAGEKRVSLAVQKKNFPALGLYHKLGFREVQETSEEFLMIKIL